MSVKKKETCTFAKTQQIICLLHLINKTHHLFMKQTFFIVAVFCLLMLAGSCDLGRAPKLSVDRELIEFPSDGGSETLNIRANAEWVASIPPFIEVSPSSGMGNGVLTVSVPRNNGATRWESLISITCRTPEAAVSKIVHVAVAPSDPYVRLQEWDPGLVPAEGGTVTGFMNTNMRWSMNCDTEGVVVTFSNGIGNPGSHEIRVDVPANPQVSERIIHLTFSKYLDTDQYGNPIPVAIFEIRQAGQGSAEI